MKLPTLLIFFNWLFLSTGSIAFSSNLIPCEHYWETKSGLVKSGIPTGTDVGISSLGSDGEYKCQVRLTLEDTLEGKYLYFGEIGDAAYLLVRKSGSESLVGAPITHGLSPQPGSSARYSRVVPFIVPVRYAYQGDGMYDLELHYRDIVPGQAGIRSGPPTVETFSGATHRAIFDSLALTYHLVQTLCLLMIAAGILFWSTSPPAQRICLTLATLAAAGLIFSITAIPRMMLPDPFVAIKINDMFHILASALIFLPLLLLTDSKSKLRPVLIVRFQLILATFYIAMIYLSDIDSPTYLIRYTSGLFILGGLTPLFLCFAYGRGLLVTAFDIKQSKRVPVMLFLFGLIIIWDIGINVFILTMRVHFFLEHFLYFLPAILWQTQMYLTKSHQIKMFPETIAAIKDRTLGRLAKENDFKFALSGLVKELSNLFSSARTSLIEVTEARVQTLAFYGDYQVQTGSVPIESRSYLKGALDSFKDSANPQQYYSGRQPNKLGKESDFYIIPIRIRNEIKCFLCLTNFTNGYLNPFILERLATVVSEMELLLSLIFLEKDNRSQSIIVQTARLRVHPLQLTSERYFLDHFDISHSAHQPAFLIGDLVDSAPLNRTYGAVKVGQAMDHFLELLFNKQKHQGFIVSRRNGDEITIIVPNQTSDTSPDQALLRLFEIVKSVITDELMAQAAKEQHIVLPFQFKMVASQGDSILSNESNVQAVPSFSLLTDSEIDAASRVLSKIALGGECLLMERAGERLLKTIDLVELPKERLRGIQNSQKLFLLNSKTNKRAA
jgi:GGDEF domain-containing protein